jgi:hypothetical protein
MAWVSDLYQPYRALGGRLENSWRLSHPSLLPCGRLWRSLSGVCSLSASLLRAGLIAHYRGTFWRLAGPLLRQGRIEDVIRIGYGRGMSWPISVVGAEATCKSRRRTPACDA